MNMIFKNLLYTLGEFVFSHVTVVGSDIGIKS